MKQLRLRVRVRVRDIMRVRVRVRVRVRLGNGVCMYSRSAWDELLLRLDSIPELKCSAN